jgi:hypothetical protein
VPWHATVIAQHQENGISDPDRCDRLGGDIFWKQATLTQSMPGLVLMASNDLNSSALQDSGNGLFAAGGRIDLQTSSSTIKGSIVATNSCLAAGSNVIQGIKLLFDDASEAPITSVIRTTQWLEYVGA